MKKLLKKVNLIGRLSKISPNLSRKVGKTGITLKKYSPEITFAFGVISFVGSIACGIKAGMECYTIIDEHEERLDDIAEACQINPQWAETRAKRDKFIAYSITARDMAKKFAPCAALAVVSLGFMHTSNKILKDRYLGAVMAFNGLSETFKLYRSRVVEDQGVDKDKEYYYGVKTEKVKKEITDEKGKKKTVEEEVGVIDFGTVNQCDYIRFFDSTNPNWDPNPEFSLYFLKAKEKSANLLLDMRGHVFLNEVLESLDMPHSQIGAIVGWVKGNGDDYIDFGLMDYTKEGVRRFVNGDEIVVPLEFNCDGIILDKIGSLR